MIKPIIYHSYSEKEALEKALIASIPSEKRIAVSQALMDIFHGSSKTETNKASKSKKSPARK
jgi:predicted GTPase